MFEKKLSDKIASHLTPEANKLRVFNIWDSKKCSWRKSKTLHVYTLYNNGGFLDDSGVENESSKTWSKNGQGQKLGFHGRFGTLQAREKSDSVCHVSYATSGHPWKLQ